MDLPPGRNPPEPPTRMGREQPPPHPFFALHTLETKKGVFLLSPSADSSTPIMRAAQPLHK
eukprot:8239856-Pyramimonas_sp.AAC.1